MNGRPVTTKEIESIKRYHKEGYDDRQIAELIDRGSTTVQRYRAALGLLPNYGKLKKKKAQYTLYSAKGQVRAFGTAEECAQFLGIKKQSVYEMASTSKRTGIQRAVREE